MKLKQETAGQRIERIRGDRTQAEFGALLGGASQSAVSAWERDDKDRAPSSAIYFRLAALAHDSDDSIFFLQQAGLQQDAVISVADVLLKKGDVKMDAILATAEQILKQQLGDQYERAKEGKDVIVPPCPGSEQLPFDLSVSARLVPNQATTFYLLIVAKDIFRRVGHYVEHGDILVFDSREVSSFGDITGEKAVFKFEDGLYIGRLGYVAEGGGTAHLVIGPSDDNPAHWRFEHLTTGDLRIIRSFHNPDAPHTSRSRREPEKVQQYLGLWVAQFSIGGQDYWKKMAQQHKPRK